jgi:hypothetical protein
MTEPPERSEADDLRDAVARVEETVRRGRGIQGSPEPDGRPSWLLAPPWTDDEPSGDDADPRTPCA